MPYLTYNLPIQRTGFRPYNMTDPWGASQLSGLSARQIFSEPGGRRLGQIQHGFSPMVLSGLGVVQTVCLDQSENTVSCLDPECTFGDCGAVDSGPIASGGCLDYSENQVLCTDPECRYGDCLTPGAKGTVALPPGSAPRVLVSTGAAPPSSPVGVPATCAVGSVRNAAGQCVAPSVWTQLTQSPTLMLLGVLGIALVVIGGKKR